MSSTKFENCVKNGGRLKTKHIKGNKYINVCYDKEGNAHASKVFTKEDPNKEGTHKAKVNMGSLLKLKEHYEKNYHNN